MQMALKLLARLGLRRTAGRPQPAGADPAFDLRLQRLVHVRPVSVSRAVLFRTRPERREA